MPPPPPPISKRVLFFEDGLQASLIHYSSQNFKNEYGAW
jgi:hypothetical protein